MRLTLTLLINGDLISMVNIQYINFRFLTGY